MAGGCSNAVSALQCGANGYHDNSMSPHYLLRASGKGRGALYDKGGPPVSAPEFVVGG